MANCMVFHTQIASIMEVLANAAVEEICKLVDDDYAVFRLEITQSQKENRGLRKKLQLLELKTARERALASRPSSVKLLDRYRGLARGEGHLTRGHRSFVKPARHNTCRDDQPITVDEGSGTSTEHAIVIEDTEAAGPGVKLERSEGEEDPQHSRDIQTEAAAGVAPPVATGGPHRHHAPAQDPTQHHGGGWLEAVKRRLRRPSWIPRPRRVQARAQGNVAEQARTRGDIVEVVGWEANTETRPPYLDSQTQTEGEAKRPRGGITEQARTGRHERSLPSVGIYQLEHDPRQHRHYLAFVLLTLS
ncbi:uncharacterized protein LOC123486092 [Coregonus clupeaformis]|uniref:uncharacterized protein LOC123486092 n=1 Tax=Coregonus clupeaformis TaxID=59861 RepID=UPI001E1C2F25|nr:uncharacterized protein LOC123486092 [Coregonus clupeaformis]